MSETRLLSCPFCGKELIKINIEPDTVYLHDNKDCFLGLFSIHNRETEKIEAWNTRKPMERIVENLEEYQNENIHEANSGFIDVCIDIVKEEGVLC